MTIEIQHPGPYDILCCKTTEAYTHNGNRVFRKLIESYSSSYAKAGQRKVLKSQVVNEIIRAVLANKGRFLQQSSSGSWTVVKKSKRREKISNALRRATVQDDRIKISNHNKDDVLAPKPQHVNLSPPNNNLTNFLNETTKIGEATTTTTNNDDMDPFNPMGIGDLSADEYNGLAEMIESSFLDPITNHCLEPLASDTTEEECSDEVASLLREWIET
mmetsp:Transcript_21052/g.31785  ORF Transcript_21052/g.31785 Transcript_21052/m.31785 type:complete len:217 (-) Transcript_21052:77-727(-)